MPASPVQSRGSVSTKGASAGRTPPVPAYAALEALATLPSRTRPRSLTSLLLAIVSLGILPAVLWPLRFRRSVNADRHALREVARWGKPRLHEAHARQLDDAAARVRFAPWLMTLGLFGAVISLGAVAWGITQIMPPYDLATWLMGLTYGMVWPRFSAVTADVPLIAFAVWTLGLVVAYLAHLAQVHLYAHGLRRFLDEFNRLSIAEGYTPVLLEPIGFGLSPWLLTAVALLMLSGFWGIPLALAGATDGRLRRRALPRMRAAIASRIRDIIFESTRPADLKPAFTRCATGGCGRPLAKAIKYCPRCGTRAVQSLDRWA